MTRRHGRVMWWDYRRRMILEKARGRAAERHAEAHLENLVATAELLAEEARRAERYRLAWLSATKRAREAQRLRSSLPEPSLPDPGLVSDPHWPGVFREPRG